MSVIGGESLLDNTLQNAHTKRILQGIFMYRTRHIEQKLIALSKAAKVVLILGARQVGKSTLLKNLFPEMPHITFDAYQDIYNVRADPDLFLKQYNGPVIFDEVQYAPELLSAIKRKVDNIDSPGQYFLAGSQGFGILKNLSETMAGRVAILTLHPMSLHEMHGCGDSHWLSALLEDPANLPNVITNVIPDIMLWNLLWRGGLPGLMNIDDNLISTLLQSYVNTYLERDLRLLEAIKDIGEFRRFLGIAAAMTAQEVNESHIGRELGINRTTAKRWLDLLEASFLWEMIPPYYGNSIKRISKKHKGLLRDTGIGSFLLRLSSPESLGSYPQFGAMFETFVLAQIRAASVALPIQPNIYHWRSSGGAEVDIILEMDGYLYPIEVKAKTHITNRDTSGIMAFRAAYPNTRIRDGVIIYAGDRCHRVNEYVVALPVAGLCK